MLTLQNSLFVLIDVQERLLPAMHEHNFMVAQLEKLTKGLQILNIPIIWFEQYPQGLGSTVQPLKSLLETTNRSIEKMNFSAFPSESFQTLLQQHNPKNIIIAGIETHICVYQTVKDLLRANYHIEVITDATASRTPENREVGIRKMMQLGANISSVEMILFELMKNAKHPLFKEISQLIK